MALKPKTKNTALNAKRKANNGSERQNETMAPNAKRKTMALNAKLN